MNTNNFRLHVDSFDEYEASVLKYLEKWLESYFGDITKVTIDDVKKHIHYINSYDNIEHLEQISDSDIMILDDEKINLRDAEDAILHGKILWEHAAAGEATRLGLGTKYLLNPKHFTIEGIVGHMINEEFTELRKKNLPQEVFNEEIAKLYERLNKETILKKIGDMPSNLMDLTLGQRHMLQMTYDLTKFAIKHNFSPKDVLSRQKTLVIVNEKTVEDIIDDFIDFNFFGLDLKNVYFMVQKSFHGIYIKEGNLFYDKSTQKNRRLHNHGQLMMQKAHEGVIFRVLPENRQREYINSSEFEELLSKHDDMLSYNIEDIGYLTNSIDLPSLSLSLECKRQGYEMVMEIVKNNPIKPQSGGACFYDKKLSRTVMIESDKLMGIKPEDIYHLNKNFNHYPNPVEGFRAMKKRGLPLTISIKHMPDSQGRFHDYIYVCPPQGDLNFILKTAYVMRKNLKSIQNWKSPATTPVTIHAMLKQDRQQGFPEFVSRYRPKEVSLKNRNNNSNQNHLHDNHTN